MDDWTKVVGKRVLITKGFPSRESVVEARVVEVSPSGERVKFRFGGGAEVWYLSADYKLIEVLGMEKALTWGEFITPGSKDKAVETTEGERNGD